MNDITPCRWFECGWLKDRFGVSRQIVPRIMTRMMQDNDPRTRDPVRALLRMVQFDIAVLQRAYDGSA